MKKKLLAICNIIIPIILFIILEYVNISDYFIDIITLTLVIGWLLPFIMSILSGITLLNDSHKKMTFLANILCTLICFILIGLMLFIYNNSFLAPIIIYTILGVLNGVNCIFYIIEDQKKNKEEWLKIKKIKAQNKGIIK